MCRRHQYAQAPQKGYLPDEDAKHQPLPEVLTLGQRSKMEVQSFGTLS